MNMGKPRIYGQTVAYNPALWRPLRQQKKQRPRPRENTTRSPVAGQIAKEKEAQE